MTISDIERTSAGFQAVIPGCERRTLPKSTPSSDDTGQGLLDFYRPLTREQLVDDQRLDEDRMLVNEARAEADPIYQRTE